MKIGHLLFPVLFFFILISGAFWIMRTVEEVSSNGANPPVYLESSDTMMEVTAESVGSTREKAHLAFIRFADSLVQNDALSTEEQEHLGQILQLGEAHWGKENWAPAFYAFERVLNELGPLVDEGLGHDKATEMEAQYSQISHSLSSEIVLVEASYLEAIEIANQGYNALLNKDWISAIQSFAKAIDTLNLVKAHAAEIIAGKLRSAYTEFEAGNLARATDLFNEVLAIHPDLEEAETGLQLIRSEEENAALVLEPQPDETDQTELGAAMSTPPAVEDFQANWKQSSHPAVQEADRYFQRRELKESLALYLEVRAKEPTVEGLNERIIQTRKVLRDEELIRLMDKAKILSELGQWSGAIKTYRHILNVDPIHADARRGWESALVSLVADRLMNQYKNLIRHHLNAFQFVHAKEVLAEARTVLHDRADFDRQFLTIVNELTSQQVPVELKLESDGETWVCIPGKMAPEQFAQKTITIFPGKFQLVGWKKGYKHQSLSVSLSASDYPESIVISCDHKIPYTDYHNLSGLDRIKTALEAYNAGGLLTDVFSFSNWIKRDEKMNNPLGSVAQVEDWNRNLFAKLYAALSQQEERAFELAHLDARGHFLEVPTKLTRKETIELGQYLVSLD